MSRVRVIRREDLYATHVELRDGFGRFAPILDERGAAVDFSAGDDFDRRRFQTFGQLLEHFERVDRNLARLA